MKPLFTSLALAICFLMATLSFGQQYETVVLNFEKSYFGENQPLPAGKYWMMTGVVNEEVPYMEVQLFPGKGRNSKPIYETLWKRSLNKTSPDFSIPVNFKLRSGNNYDILINYYRELSTTERGKLEQTLFNAMNNYVDQSFQAAKKKVKLSSNYRQIINDLNSIVKDGLSLYRSRTLIEFDGFSDIVKNQLKKLEGTKLKKGKNVDAESEGGRTGRIDYRTQLMDELKKQLQFEVIQYLNTDLYILVDDKLIENYPTEKLRSTLAIDAGYGGAIFTFDSEEFNYGSAPFIGLALPFGREGISKPFWNRTSISIGAFLLNFKDTDKNVVSGPIIKRPSYVGLGYRVWRFVKINAGATFLENPDTAGTIPGLEKRVEIRPMIGVSAQINFWLDFAK